MADSPLAEIDWDNLTDGKQSLVTALNLLEKMYGERMNVPALTNSVGNPSVTDRFPFKSNSPDYGLAGWPAIWGADINFLPNIDSYLSETKIAALLGNNNYSATQPMMSDSQMKADLGISEYPRMDIISADSVKTWYDILSKLKWIGSTYNQGESNSGSRFVESLRSGIIFNPINEPRVYNNSGNANPQFAPYAQYVTDEALVFNGPNIKEIVSQNVGNPQDPRAFFLQDQFDQGDFEMAATLAKGYSRFDITDLVNTGHIGQPTQHRCYGSMAVLVALSLGEPWKDYHDNYIYQDRITYQFPTPTRTLVTGNIYEYEVPFAQPPPMPTLTDMQDASFTASFSSKGIQNSGGMHIFDLWDAEGGFEFYTP